MTPVRPLRVDYWREPISSIGRARMVAVVPIHKAIRASAPIAPMIASEPITGRVGSG